MSAVSQTETVPAADRDTLRVLFCGSVDDGKSTLIGRVLYETGCVFEDQLDVLERDSKSFGTTGGLDFSLLVDGLEAEREQLEIAKQEEYARLEQEREVEVRRAAQSANIAAERAAKGIEPRDFTDEAIVRQYMAAMVNEAAKVVGEGIARRPLDVDMTLIFGYGFPRYHGGPLKWADMTGLPELLNDIRNYAQADPEFWTPAPLLEDLVATGRSFDDLNTKH